MHDGRFIAAVAIAVISGLVRGFSGFGSALIYIPLISALYGPRIAAPTLLLIDTICSLPFTIHAAPRCNRREVAWVSLAGFIFLPLGVTALVYVDAIVLRWLIVALVLVALAALISGWRYHGKPTVPASLATGAFAGFGGGAVQIAAPPLLIFWLSGANKAATVRANIMVYFLPQAVLAMVMYYWSGLFTRRDDHALRSARPAVRAGDGGRRLFVSRLERDALPARRLRHHRHCRHRQHAGVRFAAVNSSERYALIFCTSASDTSKLA